MFSEKLTALLSERGMTALELAQKIDVPKSIVYEWKSGAREPNAANLRKLSEFFGISIGELLEQPPMEEEELIVLLRQAKAVSPSDHDEMVASFKQSLNTYLNATRGRHDDT